MGENSTGVMHKVIAAILRLAATRTGDYRARKCLRTCLKKRICLTLSSEMSGTGRQRAA